MGSQSTEITDATTDPEQESFSDPRSILVQFVEEWTSSLALSQSLLVIHRVFKCNSSRNGRLISIAIHGLHSLFNLQPG